jgi:hypothetical protein
MKHNVLSFNPFTVEFINCSTGAKVIEKYAVALTKKEIEAEYDYIQFPSLDTLEDLVREKNPSWSNANITAKAVRMYYLNEEL